MRELGRIARRYWKYPNRGRVALLRDRLKRERENPNGAARLQGKDEERQEEQGGKA